MTSCSCLCPAEPSHLACPQDHPQVDNKPLGNSQYPSWQWSTANTGGLWNAIFLCPFNTPAEWFLWSLPTCRKLQDGFFFCKRLNLHSFVFCCLLGLGEDAAFCTHFVWLYWRLLGWIHPTHSLAWNCSACAMCWGLALNHLLLFDGLFLDLHCCFCLQIILHNACPQPNTHRSPGFNIF